MAGDGTFAFVCLPPGVYSLRAEAAGFSSSEWKDPFDGQPRKITLPIGTAFAKANFSLVAGGVITGRLTDEFGEPIDGVPVYALVAEYVAGKRRLVPTSYTSRKSDDRGQYRLFGLPPGDYYVVACPGPIAGGPGPDTELRGYVLTYYPGSLDAELAQKITVSAGRESGNADIGVLSSATYRVSGRILDSRGKPAQFAEVLLMPGSVAAVGVTARTVTSNEGAFSFTNVAPSTYVVQTLPGRALESEHASNVISIAGDTDALVLHSRRGKVIRGQIVAETGERLEFLPQDMAIAARAVDYSKSPLARGAQARINSDWTFEVSNIWGPHRQGRDSPGIIKL